MGKLIINVVLGILVILAVVIYHVPGFWIFLLVIIYLTAKTINPFRLSVETIFLGFIENNSILVR